jgi:exosortase E/protease (VPEID-CTERM system)
MAADSVSEVADGSGFFHGAAPDAIQPAPRAFSIRFGFLAFVLILEALLVFVHVRDYYRDSIARWALAFGSFIVILVYPRVRSRIGLVSGEVAWSRVSWQWIGWHICAMVVFLAAASPSLINSVSGGVSAILLAVWLGSGALAILFAGIAAAPAGVWVELLRGTERLWLYAFAASGIVWDVAPRLWAAWDSLRWEAGEDATFWLVGRMLHPLLPALAADPATHALSTGRFAVIIGGSCSGWEGLGLVLVFGVLWLWLSRRECRFPQAFILIPAAMGLIFLLNAVRIAALILIGHAVSGRVAMSGFHSQAGWIAFNMVAFGIAVVAPRIPWMNKRELTRDGPETAPNATPPWLLPLVVVLASGMVSRAASADFEWSYPLRFLCGAGAIWICRRKYSELSWSAGWLSPVAGVAAFVLWLALDRGGQGDNALATGLAALSAPSRIAWVVFRCLGAVVTVPIAEELAFRGFLLRRLISADFESVDFRRFTWFSVAASSLAFGLMHGDRWLAGTLAGFLYAAVMLRRGNIGSAVVAHATTNALIALAVLIGGKWYLW